MDAEDPASHWTLDIYGGAASGDVSFETDYTRQVGYLCAEVNGLAGRDVVRLRGHLSHERLAASLALSTFFLYPCQWEEPFGMVLIEAMALGLIPIVSRKGGIPEIVSHRANGVLIDDPTDGGSFATEIFDVSRNNHLMDEMRAQGVASVQQFSPANVAKSLSIVVGRLL
jgi:lipopolysaccharide exporter